MACGLFSIFWPRIAMIMSMLQGSTNPLPRKRASGLAARLLWERCKYSVRIYPECPRPRSDLEVDHHFLVYPTSGNGAELNLRPILCSTVIDIILEYIRQRGQCCVTYWCGEQVQAEVGSCCSGFDAVYEIAMVVL